MKIQLMRAAGVSALFGIALGACATERLDQYAAFATAGTSYVANFHKITTEAGSAMIAADSVVLIAAHREVQSDLQKHPAQYSAEVVAHDQLLQKQLAILQSLDAHATLLGSYFDAIANLANAKVATGTSAAADDLLSSINGLNGKLAQETFGGKPISDYVTVGTAFVVAHFQVKALDDQLHKAAPIIDRALSLQEAAMAAVGAEIKASLTETLADREVTDVIDPFLSPKDLPVTWNTSRESYLRDSVTLNNIDSAQAAIKQLHITFKQLVEGASGPIDIDTLIKDVSDMASYATAAEATLKTSSK